jgi:NAD+ kinase
MSSIEIFGDDEHFTSVQADGICVATPTGSTAYNLAAGGSLCHPENPVILVTAICAHTLSFRPIILPDTIVLRVGVPYDARTSSWASFDGRERVELRPGEAETKELQGVVFMRSLIFRHATAPCMCQPAAVIEFPPCFDSALPYP